MGLIVDVANGNNDFVFVVRLNKPQGHIYMFYIRMHATIWWIQILPWRQYDCMHFRLYYCGNLNNYITNNTWNKFLSHKTVTATFKYKTE